MDRWPCVEENQDRLWLAIRCDSWQLVRLLNEAVHPSVAVVTSSVIQPKSVRWHLVVYCTASTETRSLYAGQRSISLLGLLGEHGNQGRRGRPQDSGN